MNNELSQRPLERRISLQYHPVAWAKPTDLDCLAFIDGHSLPGISANETNENTEPLYGSATVLTLIDALRGMCWIEAENMMDGDDPCAELAEALEVIERVTGTPVYRNGAPVQANG